MKKIRSFIKKNRFVSIILALGFAVTMLTVLPSGSRYCMNEECGIFFWGAHEFDGVWHLSLINNAFDSIPFMNPTFAGEQLRSYNYFLDFVLSIFTRVGFSASFLYFKVLPLLWFPLLVWTTLKLTKKLKKDYIYTGFLFFFIFFGSTWMYMFTLFHEGTIFKLDSFGGALNLINMQFGFSLIVFIGIMYILESWNESTKKSLVIGLLVALNAALKFYAGFMTGFFVLVYYTLRFIKNRDAVQFFKSTAILVALSGLAVLLIYDPLNAVSADDPILKWQPFAHSQRIIEEQSQFYIKKLVLARYALQESGWGPRLIAIEMFTLALYMIFNFGTRIIAFWSAGKQIIQRKISRLDSSILVTIIVGILMLTLFVQRGQWWNTVQFFYYALFLSSFFAAQFMSDLLKKKTKRNIAIAAIIILLTLPFNIDVIRTFGNFDNPSSFIPEKELEALEFLKNEPDGTVLTVLPSVPNTSIMKKTYEKDSPYVSAYSHKSSYAIAEVNLQLLGIDYQERLLNKRESNPALLKDIDYIYAHKTSFVKPYESQLERIFSNELVTIYAVK